MSTGAAEVVTTKSVSSWSDASNDQQCEMHDNDNGVRNDFTAVQEAKGSNWTDASNDYGTAVPPQFLPLLLAFGNLPLQSSPPPSPDAFPTQCSAVCRIGATGSQRTCSKWAEVIKCSEMMQQMLLGDGGLPCDCAGCCDDDTGSGIFTTSSLKTDVQALITKHTAPPLTGTTPRLSPSCARRRRRPRRRRRRHRHCCRPRCPRRPRRRHCRRLRRRHHPHRPCRPASSRSPAATT